MQRISDGLKHRHLEDENMGEMPIEIAFRRARTLDAAMEIVDAGSSPDKIARGVKDGRLVICYGGGDSWGTICLRNCPEHIVAYIVEAREDAAHAEYSDVVVTKQTGA